MDHEAIVVLRYSALSMQQIDLIRGSASESILKRIRRNALNLVNAYNILDYVLNSSLGRRNKKVQEDVCQRAAFLNPLNSLTLMSVEIPEAAKL